MKSNAVECGHVRSGVFYNMTDLRLEKAAGQESNISVSGISEKRLRNSSSSVQEQGLLV